MSNWRMQVFFFIDFFFQKNKVNAEKLDLIGCFD